MPALLPLENLCALLASLDTLLASLDTLLASLSHSASVACLPCRLCLFGQGGCMGIAALAVCRSPNMYLSLHAVIHQPRLMPRSTYQDSHEGLQCQGLHTTVNNHQGLTTSCHAKLRVKVKRHQFRFWATLLSQFYYTLFKGPVGIESSPSHGEFRSCECAQANP